MIEVPTIEVAQVPDPIPAGVTVLDVREPVEWHHGRIDGAVHIPITEIPARAEELPVDQQLLVVCKVGSRSAQVTALPAREGLRGDQPRGRHDRLGRGRSTRWSRDGDGDPLVV